MCMCKCFLSDHAYLVLYFMQLRLVYLLSLVLTTYMYTRLTLYTQFIEIEVEYPGWSLFIGAVIILMAVLPIPIILIVRLILYQSARDEAISFFKTLRADAEHLFRVITKCRSVPLTCDSINYHPQYTVVFIHRIWRPVSSRSSYTESFSANLCPKNASLSNHRQSLCNWFSTFRLYHFVLRTLLLHCMP